MADERMPKDEALDDEHEAKVSDVPEDDEDIEHEDDDEGLSLDQLSEAYAQLIDSGIDPYERLAAAPDSSPLAEIWEEEEPEHEREVSPLTILEAIFFVGTEDNAPLANKDVAKLMRGVSPGEVDDLVVELNERYAKSLRPYHVASVGAGYRMMLRDEFNSLREKFYGKVREARLSQSAVDVLSIVAYNQPIRKANVDKLLGKSSSGVLSQLVRRQLLCIERTGKRPVIVTYRTTDRFLDLFGLESLNDLPRSQDLERNG